VIWEKVYPVVVSIGIIIFVSAASERFRPVAAITAVMPLTAPLALWIVFQNTGGDHQATAQFVGTMLWGLIATWVFLLVCWLALRARWSLPAVLLAGYGAWLLSVLAPGLVTRLIR